MNHPEFQSIKKAIKLEHVRCHEEQLEEIRQMAKKQILKVQAQQKQGFDKSRKKSQVYSIGDLVAIKRTQFLPTSKLCKRYLGPYRIVGREGNERHKVIKVGAHEVPNKTYSVPKYMKPWHPDVEDQSEEVLEEDSEDVASEADAIQGGRVWVGETADHVTPQPPGAEGTSHEAVCL